MLAVAVQIDGYDPQAGAPVTLRASSHDEPSVCHVDGEVRWPALARLPKLKYDLFDGAFAGQITSPSSSIVMQTEPWANFGRYMLADAKFRLWTGEVGAPWADWTLRFDGRVTDQPRSQDGQAQIEFAVDDRWLDQALLATYAGTTGIEGPAGLKGQVKPLAMGAPRYVPGTLIDPISSIFQVSAYGQVQGWEAALERLVRFGPPIADYPSFTTLHAATIPAGAWATCKALGLARFGAPPAGKISFLLQGDVAGPNGWARKPGQLIRRLALLSGGEGKIDDASLDALDQARPYNLSLYLDQQTTARELIQDIAASVNAVAGVSWTGKLFVLPIAIGVPTLNLAADGSALPPVAGVEQIAVGAPWRKLAITAERAWAVHELSDVAFTAELIEVGAYDAATVYREGNIVALPDGSRWLYVSTLPGSGEVPSADSLAWEPLSGASAYVDGTPFEELKPATPGATAGAPVGTTVGGVIQPDGTVLGGVPAEMVVAELERIDPIATDVSALEEARVVADAAIGSLGLASLDLAAASRQAARDVGRLDEAALRAVLDAARTRAVLRDAGVVIDQATGAVSIYAVDELAGRAARAEVTLDGQRALIASKASVAQVDEKILLAQLTPEQAAELGPLIARLTFAEQEIDGLGASVATRAAATEVTAVGGRVTGVEQELDALAGVVTTKAERTTVDALGARTGLVEQSLSTLGDVSGLSVTIRQARHVADDAGEAALRAVLAGDQASRRRIVEAAELRQDLSARIVVSEEAEATARLALAAQVGRNRGLAIEETIAAAGRDTALGQRIDAVGAVTAEQAAAIGSIAQAGITAQGGLASLTTTVRQQARGSDGTDEALLRALISGDQSGRARAEQAVQIQTELSTELVAGKRATALVRDTLLARMGAAEAAIVSSSRVAADANAATAERTTALEAAFGEAAGEIAAARASIVEEARLRVAADTASADVLDLIEAALIDPETGLSAAHAAAASARAAQVSGDEAVGRRVDQVTARLDGVGAVGVEAAFEAVVDRLGRVEGTYTLTVDVNGNVTGFQLIGSDAGPGSLNLINTDLRMGSGRIVFNNGLYMRVQGTGFGVAGDLISWFGPTMPIAACARANAISFESVDGEAHYVSVSAGTLTNVGGSSGLAADEIGHVARFGSNGGQVRFVASWSYRRAFERTYQPTTAGIAAFDADAASFGAVDTDGDGEFIGTATSERAASTIYLDRSFDGATYGQIDSASFTTERRSMSGARPVLNDAPTTARFAFVIGGGLTISDPVLTTADRWLRLRLERSFTFPDNASQRLSIISTEE